MTARLFVDYDKVMPQSLEEKAFFDAFKKAQAVTYQWCADVILVLGESGQTTKKMNSEERHLLPGCIFIVRTGVPVVTSAQMVLALLCSNKHVEVDAYTGTEGAVNLRASILKAARDFLLKNPPELIIRVPC